MLWGVIWVGGRSDLFIINRDPNAKKEGYSQVSYLEVLSDQLPTIFLPGIIFMQDNAPIHKAGSIKNWLAGNRIPILDWPPYSPDLNPIEMVWAWLKEWVSKRYPDLRNMGSSEKAYQRLYSVLQEG
jgi:transposase